MVTLRIRSSFSPRAAAVVFLAAPERRSADARMSATRRGTVGKTIGKTSASIIPAGVRNHLGARRGVYPAGKPWNRQRASGRLRQIHVSRRIETYLGPPPSKRLRTLPAGTIFLYPQFQE